MIYEGCKINHSIHPSRKHHTVTILWPDGRREQMSRAKYNMSVHINREIDSKLERVCRKNNDLSDDRIENLELISFSQWLIRNRLNRRRHLVRVKCACCGKEMTRCVRKDNDYSRCFCGHNCKRLANKLERLFHGDSK